MVGRLAISTTGVVEHEPDRGPELWGGGCKAVSALHVQCTNLEHSLRRAFSLAAVFAFGGPERLTPHSHFTLESPTSGWVQCLLCGYGSPNSVRPLPYPETTLNHHRELPTFFATVAQSDLLESRGETCKTYHSGLETPDNYLAGASVASSWGSFLASSTTFPYRTC